MLLNDCYVSFLNLNHRTDRLEHIQSVMNKAGLVAERTRGKSPNEFDLNDPKFQVMKNRTPGAIGCWLGQVEIMKKALEQGKHAYVWEDDCEICDDYIERFEIISDFLEDKNWQIMWGGATFHSHRDTWWHRQPHNELLPDCTCSYNADFLPTNDKRFVKTLGCFCTYNYIVNKDYIPTLIQFLDDTIHTSIGIDHAMIMLQPYINSYAFIPGSVRQIDNRSDIGFGDTIFSGFAALGSHWYQKSRNDFNYDLFNKV